MERVIAAVARLARRDDGQDLVEYGLLAALIAVVYLCEIIDGSLTLSHEHLDARYWPIDAVTTWHANHLDYAVSAQRVWKGLNMKRT